MLVGRWLRWMARRPQVGSYWRGSTWDGQAFRLALYRWRQSRPHRAHKASDRPVVAGSRLAVFLGSRADSVGCGGTPAVGSGSAPAQ